jgi:hypothetical protein
MEPFAVVDHVAAGAIGAVTIGATARQVQITAALDALWIARQDQCVVRQGNRALHLPISQLHAGENHGGRKSRGDHDQNAEPLESAFHRRCSRPCNLSVANERANIKAGPRFDSTAHGGRIA